MMMVPILLYHSIAEDASPKFRRWVVHPGLFATHMAYLHDHGYTALTVSQFVQAMISSDGHLPELPVVLTFDDGFACFHANALPVLRHYDFTATLYITTGFVGGTSRWLAREDAGEDEPGKARLKSKMRWND